MSMRLTVAAGGAVAAFLLSLPAVAAPDHVATIVAECQGQLGYSPSRCACFGDKAAADLSDKQQAFVAAQVTKNQAAIAQVQGTMTVNEMMGAGQFMTSVAQQCR